MELGVQMDDHCTEDKPRLTGMGFLLCGQGEYLNSKNNLISEIDGINWKSIANGATTFTLILDHIEKT